MNSEVICTDEDDVQDDHCSIVSDTSEKDLQFGYYMTVIFYSDEELYYSSDEDDDKHWRKQPKLWKTERVICQWPLLTLKLWLSIWES